MSCGIIAYLTDSCRTEKVMEFTNNLLYYSKIRGLHSTGISYIDCNGEIITEKKSCPATYFKEIDHARSDILIAHTRYSTSGWNWEDPKNAQPLQIDDFHYKEQENLSFSLCINGVISMLEKEEWEKEYKIKTKTENDSEILAKLIQEHLISEYDMSSSIFGAISMVEPCSVAGALLTKDKRLFLFRNTKRPLYTFNIVGVNGIFAASTKDIIKRASIDSNLSISKLEKVEPYVINEYFLEKDKNTIVRKRNNKYTHWFENTINSDWDIDNIYSKRLIEHWSMKTKKTKENRGVFKNDFS